LTTKAKNKAWPVDNRGASVLDETRQLRDKLMQVIPFGLGYKSSIPYRFMPSNAIPLSTALKIVTIFLLPGLSFRGSKIPKKIHICATGTRDVRITVET
jgi:hypothetical protein